MCVELPNGFCLDTVNPPLMEGKVKNVTPSDGVSQAAGAQDFSSSSGLDGCRLRPRQPPGKQTPRRPRRSWPLTALSESRVTRMEGSKGTWEMIYPCS